LKICTD